MNEQNYLEKILYGDTHGKRTFTQFRKEGMSQEENYSTEEDTHTGSKKTNDTLRRMEKSTQRRTREKKIKKLQDNPSHWRGLQ